jgi:DNA invertase Pin-like site-specific DNA recombinase
LVSENRSRGSPVVTRLDRLGRDTRDVLNLIYECEQREAFVTVLRPHVSTRGEMGQIVLTVLGMVAQMERRFIKERQRDGIEKAKAEGTYHGGKRRLDHDKILSLHRQVKARLPSHGQSGAHVCGSTAC